MSGFRTSLLPLLAALAGACTEPGAPAGAEERIAMAPASRTYALGFGVELAGAAEGGRIGAVTLAGGAGTVEIDGAARPVALHARHPWPEHDLVLYQGLVTEPDHLVLLWFYCRDGALVATFHEGTDGSPLAYQPATGRCAGAAPAMVTVDQPALALVVPPLVDTIAIDSPAAQFDGAGPGWLDRGDGALTVYPFQLVDCTGCGTPGWKELHTLVADGDDLELVCFYLHPDGRLQLVSWWSQRDPGRVRSTTLAGTWRSLGEVDDAKDIAAPSPSMAWARAAR